MENQALPTWNLSAIYASSKQWESDFDRLPKLANDFLSFKGTLGESPEAIAKALQADDDFSRLVEKLYAYAHMKSDEDTRDSEARARLGKLTTLIAELAPTQAWFAPELLAIPKAKIDKFIKSKSLQFYRRSLENILREREHILSESEERILGTYGDILGASANTFGILNDGDLDFGYIRDANGEKIPLTHGTYRMFLEDDNREIRRKAFKKLYARYKEFKNTFASTLDATTKLHAVDARTRNHPSSLHAALFPTNVPTEVYNNLIETVHSRLPDLHKYLKTRKRLLGVPKLDMWDLYCPIIPNCKLQFTWDEAVKLVTQALKPLGKEYQDILKQAFEQRWIDVPERKGKRSGGYSGGSYDTYPYILLNFHGTLDDVFTLAHELGHSIHSYYSRKTQQYRYGDYKIFVAEVASTTNEILLADHLLKTTKSPGTRSYLLSHLADSIRATIHRQTMFAEFELTMHNYAEKGVTLTADLLCDEYYKLNETYYNLKADKTTSLEWARIPHFYYNFYVYQYATGMAAAIDLANKLLAGNQEDLDKYIGFLKAGSSKDVLDIMADAGVDLASPTSIQNALDYFKDITTKLDNETKN